MFIENDIRKPKGSIEVVCGSMFSGKTEELIRRIKRAQIAKLKCKVFKPSVDTRYHDVKVVSHSKLEVDSLPVAHSKDIIPETHKLDVVGIDEAQFFDDELVRVCEHLADKGIRVIIAGLDMDSDGIPFGPMPHLLARAEFVTKLHAVCVDCGDLANFTSSKADKNQLVLLGETEEYEALCRGCFNKKNSFEKKLTPNLTNE